MNYFRGGWRLSSCGALSAQRTGLGSCPGDPPAGSGSPGSGVIRMSSEALSPPPRTQHAYPESFSVRLKVPLPCVRLALASCGCLPRWGPGAVYRLLPSGQC